MNRADIPKEENIHTITAMRITTSYPYQNQIRLLNLLLPTKIGYTPLPYSRVRRKGIGMHKSRRRGRRNRRKDVGLIEKWRNDVIMECGRIR